MPIVQTVTEAAVIKELHIVTHFESVSSIQYILCFFHPPDHPRREEATLQRISPTRKSPAGRNHGGSAVFPRGNLQVKSTVCAYLYLFFSSLKVIYEGLCSVRS